VLGKLMAALKRVRGAYSLVCMTHDAKMIGVRDPNGFRPLVIGRLKDAFVLSSETCSFDLVEAEFIREVEPGEIVDLLGGDARHHMGADHVEHFGGQAAGPNICAADSRSCLRNRPRGWHH